MQGDRLVQVFLDLVKIDSPSGHEEKVIECVSKFVQKLGLKSIQDTRGNLIVKVDGAGEPILLGAHLDTVEPGRNISPRIANGIIKSNGTTILGADNKVAVAAILEVLRLLVENKIQTRPLDVVFTLAEETEFGSGKLDYGKIEAKKGYIFDSLIPVGCIVTASPFCNDLQIKIIGKAAHASLPHEAINALNVLAVAIGKIKLGKINNKTIANIGIVTAGHMASTVPGEAVIRGEVRSFVKKEVEKYSNLIINKFKQTAFKLGAKIEAKIIESCPGYEYSASDEFIKTTGKKIKDFGLQPTLIKKWACSDANIFNNRDMQILNLGDGVVNAHTVDERVSVDDLTKLGKLVLYLATN